MTKIHLTDPMFVPEPSGPFGRFAASLIHDHRDVPFMRVQLVNFLVMVGLAVWNYVDLSIWSAAAFLLWYYWQLGPYTLMLHNVSHRRYLKKPYQWLQWPFIVFLGTFFGHTPASYFAHHIGMHHPENNLDDDLSSTMHLQRDSAADFFGHYLVRFLFLGTSDLSGYLKGHHRVKMRRTFLASQAVWLLFVVALCLVNWKATLLLFVFTVISTRTAMMAGNWGQHAFVDASRPENCYVNSITCINSSYNRRAFNDGYHISHHWSATRHWTEHPQELLDNLDEYAKNDAIIFEKIDFFMVWLLLMFKAYDQLAKYYVPIDNRNRSHEEVVALLQERTRRIEVSALSHAA